MLAWSDKYLISRPILFGFKTIQNHIWITAVNFKYVFRGPKIREIKKSTNTHQIHI